MATFSHSLPDLSHFKLIAIDTETTGLSWWADYMFSIAISADNHDWYVDVREGRNMHWLADQIRAYRGTVVAHNAKFDTHFMREAGADMLRNPHIKLECTMIRAALIDEHRFSYDLDSLLKSYVPGVEKKSDIWPKLAELFGGRPTRDAQAPNLQRAPKELVGEYAIGDSRGCLELYHKQTAIITHENLGKVLDLENRLLPKIICMEKEGVPVNVEATEAAVETMGKAVAKLQGRLNKLAKADVNVNPSKSLTALFDPKPRMITTDAGKEIIVFDTKFGDTLQATPAGKPCIDQFALRKMKAPEAALVLQIRLMRKTRETFLMGHILGHHHNGIVHANINQTKSDNDLGTGTGRFSINAPALQQIHKRNKEIAVIVRSLFVPDPGSLWLCRDWSQMDFRVFAHYTNDPTINEVYAKNPDADFHRIVADITGLPRDRDQFTGGGNAKQINLGMVFGMGPGTMAQEMGLPYHEREGRNGKVWIDPGEEAQAVFARYHEAIPGVKRILENVGSVAKSRGYITTAMGRRIRFPKGATYKAGGLLFQGTAADALKVKIIEVDDYLRARGGGRLMLNVHDEFDINVEPDHADDINSEVGRILEKFDGEGTPIKFRVPIKSSGGIGVNWWEASK